MTARLIFAALLAAAVALPALAAAPLAPGARYALAVPDARFAVEAAGVDRAQELAADVGAPKSRPLRYAVAREIHNAASLHGLASGGEWRELPDGKALWRLPVHAAGARTLDFGFRRLFLPQGAQLFVSNAARTLGPYTDADNTRSGEFWTPLLYGDDALIEVLLPQSMKAFLAIDLGTVHVGYRDIFAPAALAKSFFDPGEGSGDCNLDTICPQGDPWRSEINAESILVFSGGFCSGQLLNDTRSDHVPYLSTANHCISSISDANSLVVYWKYEAPVCRAPFSTVSGEPVPTDQAIPQTGGATLIATDEPSDFTLVRLNTPPPAAAQAYWNGWDRSETPFSGAVVMHHPESDAKRISFTAGTVSLEDDDGSTDLPGEHHWYVDHYAVGTTEEGSSGSGLIDASHHLRGVLSGGRASCSFLTGEDYYGRLSAAWEGGGTPLTRMRDWLDPANSGALTVEGSAASTSTLSASLNTSVATAISGQTVTLTATASGGTPPYAYAFDVDGDGVADNLDHAAASMIASYPGAFSGNVGVTISDQAGHSATASRALVVQAPDLSFFACPFECPNQVSVTQLCGSAGQTAPGTRLKITVPMTNQGSAATKNAYAVFAQNLSLPGQAKITLENPAVALPDTAPAGAATIDLIADVDADSACGADFEIDYVGVADDNGFSGERKIVLAGRTPDAPCQANMCAAQLTPIIPARGNFFDPTRAGSGITQFLQPVSAGGSVYFGAWFTGDASRYPTWYLVNDFIHGNQVNTTLLQTHLTAPNQFPETGSAVGSAQVSLISPSKFAYTWVLNGKPGGGIYVPLTADPQSSLRSWFNTDQSGWGTFDELIPSAGSGGNPFLFNLDFLYDSSGTPRWTTAQDGSYADGKLLTEMVARPSCPSCVWLDYTIGAQSVGTQTYLNNSGAESISTNLTFPSAYPGSWIRNNLPLTPLVPPQ